MTPTARAVALLRWLAAVERDADRGEAHSRQWARAVAEQGPALMEHVTILGGAALAAWAEGMPFDRLRGLVARLAGVEVR